MSTDRDRAVTEVVEARFAWKRAEAALQQRILEAAAAGVSERELAQASGISRATVRRIIGREKP